MTEDFDRDTSVERLDDVRFTTRLDERWWIVAGPNGGYLAAVILRAMTEVVAAPARAPRSLSVQYLARPEAGAAAIDVRAERRGRSLTSVSTRLYQGDRLIALALGSFSKARSAPEFQDAAMPDVPPPDAAQSGERFESAIPMHDRYEYRWAVSEEPWAGAERARSGAWTRLRERRRVDAPLAAAITDALPPAIFTRTAGKQELAVPTVDLTIHFRCALPLPGARPEDFTLAVFTTRTVRDGFLEEDGELWSESGVLIAQSRQLALVI